MYVTCGQGTGGHTVERAQEFVAGGEFQHHQQRGPSPFGRPLIITGELQQQASAQHKHAPWLQCLGLLRTSSQAWCRLARASNFPLRMSPVTEEEVLWCMEFGLVFPLPFQSVDGMPGQHPRELSDTVTLLEKIGHFVDKASHSQREFARRRSDTR